MELEEYLKARVAEVDAALDEFLPGEDEEPARIHEAMRYSIFAGGKRLRPILCLAAAEACGGEAAEAMPAACALELTHTYSLVHDDLPCMDDDDLRRGRPTSHKVYGEGLAVLTGDALLTEAFRLVGMVAGTERYPAGRFPRELAEAAGSRKLIGGQVLDLEGEGRPLTRDELVKIHSAKTAALLVCSVRLGAMSADVDERALAALTNFGHSLGLAFQAVDDILDVTQPTEGLGKTAGKDEAVKKATYPSVFGLEEARAEAARLTDDAMEALDEFGEGAEWLRQIARYLLDRTY